MKIAINQQFGDVDQIKIVEVDKPELASDEVLVKVKAAGLNPKDILIRKGKFKRLTGSKFPQNIGFDFAGVIEDPNNSPFQHGEKVFGMINGWHGRCCAEYVNVNTNELYAMPSNITFEEAAGIPLASQTALQALRDSGNLSKGKTVLINGASGGVGTLSIQIAKAFGAEVTTVSSTKNRDMCASLGADQTISYQEVELTDLKEKYDLFFDAFGNYSYSKINSLLTVSGRYVTTVPKPEIFKEQVFNLFRKKKAKIVVVKSNKSDLKWIYEKIRSNRLKPVVDKVYKFADIQLAQKYIESKRARGKVILAIDSDLDGA